MKLSPIFTDGINSLLTLRDVFFSINVILQHSKLKSHSHQNSKIPGNKEKKKK